MQRAALTATKSTKNAVKISGEDGLPKSYYIKMTVLWLAKDRSSDAWTGITAGVLMVLDWLDHRLEDGNLSCFFWPDINLLEPVSRDEQRVMGRTVVLMRTLVISVLISITLDSGFSLDPVLKGGSEPLSESELCLRLSRV